MLAKHSGVAPSSIIGRLATSVLSLFSGSEVMSTESVRVALNWVAGLKAFVRVCVLVGRVSDVSQMG